MNMTPQPARISQDAAIVSKAAVRAAERLELPGRLFASIIGVSEATVSRMKTGDFALDRDRNAFQLSLLFVRLYRSLDAIVGGNAASAASWFKSHNTALDARPVEAVQSIAGLVHVIDYLDSRRAPL
ncbi:antitoxin Xre/MbcA/ParS toxin-binding domain-containing protein [Microvirga sp. TS319]|uniref:antitoxin Xre/MbcA/ParS toxin-binding domain-containing protein n=1 Tax=Microvirga sp. TS319 TaxID=3241165 RepID=UPI003519EBC7